MNKLCNLLEYIFDLLFFLALYFFKPFAKIVVDVFYAILSIITKDYEILSVLVFFVPLIIFIFINKLVFSLLRKRKENKPKSN